MCIRIEKAAGWSPFLRTSCLAKHNGGDRMPPSLREVASPTGLTEGVWSLTVSSAVDFMPVELPQSAS